MVAEDFLQDPQVRRWLDGVEPAWTLLSFGSLQALREEPSAGQSAIRIANDLDADEIAGSAVARNTFILLEQAIERGGLPLTATGNLSRAVVAEMRELIEWPGYDQADAFRLHKVLGLLRFTEAGAWRNGPSVRWACTVVVMNGDSWAVGCPARLRP
jgi:hypothetical protein